LGQNGHQKGNKTAVPYGKRRGISGERMCPKRHPKRERKSPLIRVFYGLFTREWSDSIIPLI